MQITNVSPESLIEYAFNNRKHSDEQIDLIANSIKDFGFNQPIVVDEDNIILVGHGRLRAAKKLELTEVPVFKIVGLSEIQKRAYRILDNKIQNDSEWDFEKLNIELPFLENEGFDLEAWGLDDLLLEAEPEIEVKDDEFEPTEQTETYIKVGDLIELGRHRVLCGDSTEEDSVKSLLGEKKPFLMVTDPPYGVEYDANWRNLAIRQDGTTGKGRAIGKVTNDDRADWSEAYSLSGVDVAYVWHADKNSSEVQVSLEKAGFNIRCQIIWAKSNFAIGRGDYHWKHEPCWYAVKEGKSGHYCGDRSQTTLWEIDKPQKSETGHSTQKPIECMARPIKNNSSVGDIAYDPFLGSGTTLIAAEQLDRICYGMEIEPKYCQVIIERYKNHCEKNEKEFVCKVNGKAFDFPN